MLSKIAKRLGFAVILDGPPFFFYLILILPAIVWPQGSLSFHQKPQEWQEPAKECETVRNYWIIFSYQSTYNTSG